MHEFTVTVERLPSDEWDVEVRDGADLLGFARHRDLEVAVGMSNAAVCAGVQAPEEIARIEPPLRDRGHLRALD